jgi:HSP20 family protein
LAQQEEKRPARSLVPWADEFERLMNLTREGFFPFRGHFPRFPRIGVAGPWVPDIDVFDKEGNVVVRADLPGMKREDLDVAVERDTLVIRGSRKEESEVNEKDYYRSERITGEFYRSIALPEGSDPSKIDASYRDGVLEIKVPRVAPPTSEARKVEVKE